MSLTRRQAISAIGAATLFGGLSACGKDGGAGGSATAGGSCQTKSSTVSVGFQPYAAENSPITVHMKDNQLFEKMAQKFCYDLTIEYKEYPAAAPMVPQMIAGRLDFGMWGDTPTLTAVAQNQPLTIISMGEGHMRFVIATREDSGITNLEDLQGKTVGVLLGGDPELALLGMLEGVLGTSDTAALGIKMVNIPTQAAAATVPKGVDASLVIHPALLKQQQSDDSVVAIADSFGFTGEGYDGPEGTGAGNEFPSATGSPFAPEGFYAHRSTWLTRDKIIDEDPGIVSAFLAAEQQAVTELSGADPGEVSDTVQKYWELSPDNGAKVLGDALLFQRKFSWATHGDAVALLKLSEVMAANKIIEAPLTWDQLTENFAKGADVAKEAYEVTGSDPDASAFEPTDTDPRGKPTWEVNEWPAPSGQ